MMSSQRGVQRNIVIVGGGLSGLHAARCLSAALSDDDDVRIHVLEGRGRLGGRTLSSDIEQLDLGASWIWPSFQPSVKNLVAALQVKTVPESDFESYRFVNGSQELSTKLAAAMPPHVSIHMQSRVLSLAYTVDNGVVDVVYKDESLDEQRHLQADVVFMACPPRLILDQIELSPSLPSNLLQAMSTCRTWMSQQSKFIVEYASAFWRAPERQAMYWTRIPGPGPLQMIFENGSTIWGFFTKEARRLDSEDRMQRALTQLSGVLGSGALTPLRMDAKDWSADPFTCSVADAAETHPWEHPRYANDLFQSGYWSNRLWFIGSETCHTESAGFLDGAVLAASTRIAKWRTVRAAP